MSEDGCLSDALFNTLQVVSGSVADAFPSGIGPMKGLTIESNNTNNFFIFSSPASYLDLSILLISLDKSYPLYILTNPKVVKVFLF